MCAMPLCYAKVTAQYRAQCQRLCLQIKRVILAFALLFKGSCVNNKHLISAPVGIQYSRQHKDLSNPLEKDVRAFQDIYYGVTKHASDKVQSKHGQHFYCRLAAFAHCSFSTRRCFMEAGCLSFRPNETPSRQVTTKRVNIPFIARKKFTADVQTAKSKIF